MRHVGAFPGLVFAILLCCAPAARAQISLTSAVDLAIRNSPRVKSSKADVDRARAALAEAKDVYIPTLSAGASLGQAYGYSNYPPTLFTLTSNSLVYNASQTSYVRAAAAGLESAQRSLEDVREIVAEDAALTFVALDHDQQREEVLRQESEYSNKLLQIVQQRFDAGLDSRMNLLDAQLSVANLKLGRLRAHNDTANDQAHLARLMGVPQNSLRADGGFPATPIAPADQASTGGYANASVAAAYANARSKQAQARGDQKFLYRPQVSFVAQYNRYATFTNAWKLIYDDYSQKDPNTGQIIKGLGADEEVFGVQINIPLLDRGRRSRAMETAAEATKALHDAEFAQVNVLDAQGRLTNSIELLQAQADVASIEQQRAQEQLAIVQTQLANPASSPVPMTPKDEQNARIGEREKYLAVIDSAFNLHQSQISLLRQTGHLEEWLLKAGLPGGPVLMPTPQPSVQPQP
jgi:outer membrane protein TolC